MRPSMVLLGSAVVFTAIPAFAQNPKPNPKSIDPQTTCSASPGSKDNGPKKESSSALNNKLSSCGGVLKPPAVGDNMAKRPPKTGNSRVIKPKDLPDQQSPNAPKQNDD
ncbi:MAG: hypothetical protein ACTHJV_03210 [Rhizobiaceae bacterium]